MSRKNPYAHFIAAEPMIVINDFFTQYGLSEWI